MQKIINRFYIIEPTFQVEKEKEKKRYGNYESKKL